MTPASGWEVYRMMRSPAKETLAGRKTKMSAPEVSPDKQREAVRKFLTEMRQKLFTEISGKLASGPLKTLTETGDSADLAGQEREKELALLFTDREKEKLQGIDEALDKLQEGTYGVCEECSEKIEPGRLKVLPLARFCVNCQSKLEKESVRLRRGEEPAKYQAIYPEEEEETEEES